jgi:hypothetical protein
MTTQGQIQAYLEQPRRYFNIDGLGELGCGIMMLGFGLISWLQATTPQTAVWHRMWFLLVYMAVILTVIDRGTKVIKKRVTYPRTGFVEYRGGARGKIIPMVSAALLAPVFLFLFIQRRVNAAALLGIAFAIAYTYGMARAVRWKWLVAAVLAAGTLAIASLPTGLLTWFAHDTAAGPKLVPDQFGIWMEQELFIGATMLFSGAITLYQYLSRTQAPDQGAE